ncbi:MAG: hypothetical protein QOH76_2401, partial [Thermoleophilaceae bacterium]|nr:hypothetical protein [Thermoleophilaceae bacterium]
DSFKYKAKDPSNVDSNEVTVDVTINGANDAPTLSGIEGTALAYDTGDPGTPITSTLSVADIDDANLKSGSVDISLGYVNGADTLSSAGTANITASWSAATHILTLSTDTGGAPKSEWDTALRSVKFFSAGPTPSGTRTVSFQVDDGHAASNLSNVATRDITVTNDNVAPTDIALSQDTVATGQPSGAAVGTLSSTDADLGDSHTYTLVSGTGDDDNGKFQISGSTLQTSQALTAGDYKVRVQTDDGRGGTFQKAFTIHAIDDAPPTDISLSNDTVAENQPLGTDIGTLTTTDADGGPTFTYTLVAGNGTNDADNNDFQINGDILEVKNPPNFEADATRQVYIRSDDGKGAHIDKAFTINVTNVNEAPTSVLLDNSSVAENQPAATTIGNLSATDPDAGDAASMTFTLAAGVTDNDKFQITGNVLKTGQSFNFEAQSSYTVTVTAKDTGNLTKDQAFPITITNVNETPAVTAGATLGYTENQAPQQVDNTITVTEPDGTNLSSASASITGNFQSGEDVLSWVDNDGLDSITLQPSTNQTINLSGPGTAAQYAAALKAVKYNNTSEAPTTAARTVTFSVTDPTALTGSATSTINVTSVDDPPDAVNDPGGAVTLAQTTVLEDANATAIPVLNNDTDVDAGLKEITAIGATSDGATVTGTGGSANHWTGLTYKPALNYCNSPDTTASADPETFTYTLNGGDTATVSMTVTCVNDAPVADDETFNGANSAVGNTTFVSNDPDDGAPTTPDPTDTGPSAAGRPHKTITGDILAGDTDVDGPGPLTVKDTDGTPDSLSHQTTTGGGTVAIEPDGDFVYEPKPNASSCPTSDTFTYTVKDAFSPTPGEGTGTVTIEIAGCVWYVNNNDAGGDNGTSEKPYDNLGEAQAVADSGDSIFVYQGSSTPTTNQYAGGFDLLASQKLVGEAATLTAGSPAATLHSSDASNRPTLTDNNANVVNLDDSNTVAGVGIDPQGTGGGIAGASGDTGGGTIDDVQIADNGTAGTLPGLELDSTTGTFNISNLTVNNGDNNSATSTDSGIRLNNAGTVNFASTGTISVTTNSAKGLDATNGAGTTNMGTGSVFDDVTVTNSGSGGVNLNGTTGATQLGNGAGTDLSLTTTSGTAPALKVSNGGTVSVPGAGTANLTSAGGPAADVTGTSGATFDLDTVTANTSGTAEDGINLAGLVTGTFTATGGTLTGGSGIEFDLDGGSGTITYPGTFADTPNGKTAEITGRTSGAVSFSGAINDSTAGAGGGITVGGAGALSNTGGSTTFSNSSKKLDTGASNAVTLSNSDGHTLNLTNGLDVTTTSGKGVEATSSGTLNIPSGGTNTIVTGSGKGLEVQNTDVAATPLTFEKIAGNGANAGILLNNTGANNALTVTGTGGTCSNADSSGCTGGTIQNTTGADDAGNTPPGTAVVLNSTKGVSLTRMRLADNSNYGMRGNSVSGLTFNNSVVNGSNGTSVLTANKDSSMRFTELTGTVGMSNTDIAGGLFSNLIVINTSGPALNATLDSVDSLGMNTATGADNAVLFEGTGSATTNVSFTNGSVTSARGQMLHYIGDGTGGGNLTLTNDNFINGNPLTSQSTGGGGVSAVAGATGAATMDIQNNTFQNSKTNALTIIKSHDIGGASGSFSGTINNNTIGTAGTANSGSSEGDGMEITNEGTGNMTVAVTNNHVHQINSSGFQFVAGAGIASSGQFNINFSGNSVDNPGNNGSVTLLQSVRIDSGVTSGDTFATCANFGANTITGSSDAANKDFRLVVNQSTTIRLPGYAGGSTDGTAVAAFVAGKIGSGAQGTAVANSPGTFTGSGATCP